MIQSTQKVCIWLVLLLVIAPIGMAQAQTMHYSFGVVPQQSATILARNWLPLLNYVSRQSGLRLEFKTAPNIPEFEKRLLRGDYDFAYMNPYHYTVAHARQGYEPFAARADKKIKGILVVRNDKKITSIAALQGKSIVFPSPGAFAASILIRAELKSKNIQFTPVYVSSHDSVYRNVAHGHYPAGGGIVRTFSATSKAISTNLSILMETQAYMPHAFAVHPRVASENVDKIRQIILTLHTTPGAANLLEPLKISALKPAVDRDWDEVRALRIELLDK